VRVFFTSAADRDAARLSLASRFPATTIEVSDEDWASRSQANLQPITIGRLTIHPRPSAISHQPSAISHSIVIQPSMGFGTGHHATTRLCLEALQTIDLTGATVLDVGTGSGILAIAAVRLGAAQALGIDVDDDAIQAARENLTLNPEVADRVAFEVEDIAGLDRLWRRASALHLRTPEALRHFSVLTANLTGHLLVQSASVLQGAVRAGGTLIVSGLQLHEREAVLRAFAASQTVWERTDDEWVGLAVKTPSESTA
jgi:ribosomal protein L11 methyltransferase